MPKQPIKSERDLIKNLLYISPSADGHVNLARDEYFLDHTRPGEMLLHLYVNANAVIIGANQNPWAECSLSRMEADGVQLVRRVTGGGAVFHDAGNLNFSFIAGEGRYDLDRQLGLILNALRALGIPCERSGRNDLTSEGQKFSGSAFITRNGVKQHHGTLLIDANLTRLQNYLNVDPRKLSAKGVKSVRARVCNLRERAPELTVPAMREALCRAYAEGYGACETLTPPDEAELAPYLTKQRSDEWRLGKTHPFDAEWDERFAWGGLRLLLTVRGGTIVRVQGFSDANDALLVQTAAAALEGCPYGMHSVAEALRRSGSAHLRDMADAIEARGT